MSSKSSNPFNRLRIKSSDTPAITIPSNNLIPIVEIDLIGVYNLFHCINAKYISCSLNNRVVYTVKP